MSVERVSEKPLIDVLDRVLDKGIVIDAWARVRLLGIELLATRARAVVEATEVRFGWERPARGEPPRPDPEDPDCPSGAPASLGPTDPPRRPPELPAGEAPLSETPRE